MRPGLVLAEWRSRTHLIESTTASIHCVPPTCWALWDWGPDLSNPSGPRTQPMGLNHLDTLKQTAAGTPHRGPPQPHPWSGAQTHTVSFSHNRAGVIRNTAFKQLSVALKGNQGRSHRGEQTCKEACIHQQTNVVLKMQPSGVEEAQHQVSSVANRSPRPFCVVASSMKCGRKASLLDLVKTEWKKD